jgi:hypothetical protein
MAVHRAASITVGLIVIGAITGALCGAATMAPLAIAEWVRPSPEPTLATLAGPTIAVVSGAVIGGILGAILAPLVAWGWLRHVALWRVILTPTLGSLAGASIGWMMGFVFAAVNPVALLLGCSLFGAVGGSLLIRRRGKELLSAASRAST